jgi:hypothetical protein
MFHRRVTYEQGLKLALIGSIETHSIPNNIATVVWGKREDWKPPFYFAYNE